MKGLSKILSLPSNGLSYDPFIRVRPLEFGSLILLSKSFYTTSESEMMECVIHSCSDANTKELYYGDAVYIYNYILAMSVKMREFSNARLCESCKTKNVIKLPIETLNVKWLPDHVSKNRTFNTEDDISFNIRRRKLIDNFYTATKMIQEENEESVDRVITNFIQPQIESISFNGEVYDKDKIYEALMFMSFKDKFLLYEFALEEDYGYDNKFEFSCRECNHKNTFYMWDAFNSAIYRPSEDSDSSQSFHSIFNLIASKRVRMEELLELPNILYEDLIQGLNYSIEEQNREKR